MEHTKLQLVQRTHRIAGQVGGIRRMIESGASCPDVLTQLKAARAALRALENCLIEQDFRDSLTSATDGPRKHDSEESARRNLKRMVAMIRRV